MNELAGAAQLARHAPSVSNTQPWRWLVHAGCLELYADRDRHLGIVDPDRRLMTMSCGAALHHARIALAAAGHDPVVDRWPHAAKPDLVARIRLAGPHRPVPRRVPVREFSIDPRAGADPGPGQDRGAVYAILFGDDDTRIGWLRAGEALSAVLLTAVAHGLAAAPMTDVVEVPAAREMLRTVLCGLGHPYAAVRVGIPMPRAAEPPATPRRCATATVEYAQR